MGQNDTRGHGCQGAGAQRQLRLVPDEVNQAGQWGRNRGGTIVTSRF